MKWNDFHQKKSSSSFNQNEDIRKSLEDCVKFKKTVVKMFDDYILHTYDFDDIYNRNVRRIFLYLNFK